MRVTLVRGAAESAGPLRRGLRRGRAQPRTYRNAKGGALPEVELAAKERAGPVWDTKVCESLCSSFESFVAGRYSFKHALKGINRLVGHRWACRGWTRADGAPRRERASSPCRK